jgi:glycosyltransferase involved in cell wall biosynthesis
VRHAARQRADVHHIVGDSHYLVFGLPLEKTVLTIHDCAALNRLKGLKCALLKYFWFAGPMRRAAVVTTISQASKDELRKWVGPLADKVVVVSDCVFGEFAYDPKPFNEESPVVLQVGTKWNKNVERVIEAVRGTGFRLEIVGNLEKASHGLTRIKGRISPGGCADLTKQENSVLGDPSTRNALPEGKPTEDGSDSRIRELGRLTDEELVEAYRRCDMVVFASLYEGFGLPILEAQAMGRPVITSNFGAMREAAGDGALLVDPYSVEAIREAVLRIKREPALREDLIAKGLRNAAKFSADAVALKYAQIYKSLATD